MAIIEASRYDQPPITILAGVAKVVDIPMGGATGFSMTLKRLSGSIDSVDVETSALGDDFGPDTEVAAAIGSITTSVPRKIDVTGINFIVLRLTFHAAVDTSCQIRMRGGK